jgi:hypothetical protein
MFAAAVIVGRQLQLIILIISSVSLVPFWCVNKTSLAFSKKKNVTIYQ